MWEFDCTGKTGDHGVVLVVGSSKDGVFTWRNFIWDFHLLGQGIEALIDWTGHVHVRQFLAEVVSLGQQSDVAVVHHDIDIGAF